VEEEVDEEEGEEEEEEEEDNSTMLDGAGTDLLRGLVAGVKGVLGMRR
jgi:hypothetical protein